MTPLEAKRMRNPSARRARLVGIAASVAALVGLAVAAGRGSGGVTGGPGDAAEGGRPAAGAGAAASSLHRPTTQPLASLAEPAISPDGSEIAFMSAGDVWTV